MNYFRSLCSLLTVCIVVAFAALGAQYTMASFTLPSVNGPSLGDSNVNAYTLADAINRQNNASFGVATAAGSTQATCTPLLNAYNNITAASTAGVCLPAAVGGTRVVLSNPGGNTMYVYSSNTPFVSGTADTINGTAGSTAYQVTTGKIAICHSVANGVWGCVSGT